MSFIFNKKITYLIFFVIICQLLVFTFLVPPFQKPDEYGHFIRSASISKGTFICTKQKNNLVKLDSDYIDLLKKAPVINFSTDTSKKMSFLQFLSSVFSTKRSNGTQEFNLDDLCSFPFVAYLPQALALKAISIFRLNSLIDFYFGRLIMSSVGFIWFLYLFKKINHDLKSILLFTFALPMTLHQVSSYSYDAVHIMLGLSFFALLINYLAKSQLNGFDAAKLFIILGLFISVKRVGYELFTLLVLLLPLKKIGKKLLLTVGTFLIAIFLIKSFLFLGPQESPINKSVRPLEQLQFIANNPINFGWNLLKTSLTRGETYLQGTIGLFGWLEYGLEPLTYLIYLVLSVLIIYQIRLSKSLKLKRTQLILLSITLVLTYTFIQILTYLYWTPFKAPFIDGAQGRYFIVFVPWTIFLLLQFKKQVLAKVGFVLVLGYLAISVFNTVFSRYFY